MFEPVCVVKRDSHFSTQIPFSDTTEITEMPAWKRPYCSCRFADQLAENMKGYESFTITNVEECCMNPRKLLQPCPLWRRQTDHISNLLPQFESLVPLPRLHKFGATSHWKYIEIWRHHPLLRTTSAAAAPFPWANMWCTQRLRAAHSAADSSNTGAGLNGLVESLRSCTACPTSKWTPPTSQTSPRQRPWAPCRSS